MIISKADIRELMKNLVLRELKVIAKNINL